MTRRRWIADEVAGDRAFLVGKNAYHLARVLRAKAGQQFDVVTNGRLRRGTVASVSDQRVAFELAEEVPAAQLPIEITLLLSIFKFDRMEWVLEKATELGVVRVVPIIARRTEKHLASAAPKRVERWRRITQQAAQQTRRLSPLEIAVPVKLEAALAVGGRGLVLAEAEQEVSYKQAIVNLKPTGSIQLAIGPEGGWTSDELERFRAAQWVPASLGKTILRTETAAIASIAILISELT